MLAADRSAVETDLQAQAVQIKNLEMNNIDRYLQAIGTQAALILGFAAGESYAVEKFNVWSDDYSLSGSYWWLAMGYYICQSCTMVFEMYCVMTATLISVLGPTLALNGPKGSMTDSVNAMKEERIIILHSFWLGALSFVGTQAFAVFANAPGHTSFICFAILALGTLTMYRAMDRIKQKFRYQDIYAGDDDGKGRILKRGTFPLLTIFKRMFEGAHGGEGSSSASDHPSSGLRSSSVRFSDGEGGVSGGGSSGGSRPQSRSRASSANHVKASVILDELESNNNSHYLEAHSHPHGDEDRSGPDPNRSESPVVEPSRSLGSGCSMLQKISLKY